MQKNAGQLAEKSGDFLIGGDLPIAQLGFGAMRITGNGIWGQPADRPEAIRVLRHAVELGVVHRHRGRVRPRCEVKRSSPRHLHPYPAGLVIATKGGFHPAGVRDQWVENGRPEYLKSACEESLRRLRLERIDLYQLHRIDAKVPAEDQLGALKASPGPKAKSGTSVGRK